MKETAPVQRLKEGLARLLGKGSLKGVTDIELNISAATNTVDESVWVEPQYETYTETEVPIANIQFGCISAAWNPHAPPLTEEQKADREAIYAATVAGERGINGTPKLYG